MSKEEKGKNEPIKGPLPNLVVSSDVDGDRPTLFDAFNALLADASLLPLLKKPSKMHCSIIVCTNQTLFEKKSFSFNKY